MRATGAALAIGGAVAAAPAFAFTDAYCTYSETPPAPPDNGAVLWSPPAPGSTDPNTVVFPPNSSWYDLISGCTAAVAISPRVISVAPGAAIQWLGGVPGATLISPWGAVNVGLSDPAPVIVPPNWQSQWQTSPEVIVQDAVAHLQTTTSCRNCDLSKRPSFEFPGSSIDPDFTVIQFALDVGGSNFTNSKINGDARGYDFSGAILNGVSEGDGAELLLQGAKFDGDTKAIGAHFDGAELSGVTFPAGMDLTGATFVQCILDGAVFDHAVVSGTVFDSAWLRGARMDTLQFTVSPSFAGTLIGGIGLGPCSVFANMNLSGSSFDGATWALGCSGAPFPGSQISVDTLQQLLSTPQLSAAPIDWTGAQVVASAADRGVLAGVDLSGANLAGLSFLGEALDLTGTHFDGANLTGTSFALARLAGATFANVTAPGASFEDADLSGDGTQAGANFSGPTTNLQGASFVNADISGASFVGADLTRALFSGARGVEADFSGVVATGANFANAHLYGNGQAFDSATDLQNIDFSGAVLAGDASQSGGFDLTGAELNGGRFDGAVCVDCNFTNAVLDQNASYPGASFTGAYLPGVQLAGAQLAGATLDGAWLYCGDFNNSFCQVVQGSQPLAWQWPLALGSGEAYGPVPFTLSDLSNVNLADVAACPDGKPGATPPAGCQGHLLPSPSTAPAIPAPCSASAHGACPTTTATLLDATAIGAPIAVAASAPPTWNTTLSGEGQYVAFDDGTVRLIDGSSSSVIAGTAGTRCSAPTAPCGDSGPATAALLGSPTGLAVGLDGSLYIADPGLLRVRRVDPAGTMTTVAGTGAACTTTSCGDGGPATAALLAAANGVSVDTHGVLLIADGPGGVRRVGTDGTITTLALGSATSQVVSVVQDADGRIYAATHAPDGIVQVDSSTGSVTPVVGTGTSGYNGNTDPNLGLLLPGTQVQVNQPTGLVVDLDGHVLFADSGNHLIRAYVPSTGHVIDDLAGAVVNGAPQGGFNGDGHWASDTQLDGPLGVAATRGALLVVADSGNRRVRQVGPGPADTSVGGPRVTVLLSCRPGRVWSCRRLPVAPGTAVPKHAVAVTLSHRGTVFATGQRINACRGRLRFLVTEQRPLVPGRYQLTKELAAGPRAFTVWLR